MTLEAELACANGQLVSLVLQQEQLVRDGEGATKLEDAIRKAHRRQTDVMLALLAHRRKHEHLSRPKIQSAGDA